MNKDEYGKKLISDVVASIIRNGGDQLLTSVILTGSFGREEPTWTLDEKGETVLKSDVEIALVRKESTGSDAMATLKRNVCKEFKEDLNLMTFNEKRVSQAHNYNRSFQKPRYYTLFNFDFYNASKTIWGHDYISEITISLDDVDPYEAKRIVANRIGELVYLTNQSEDYYTRAQWKGKVMLAIGTAWLLLKKTYISNYHGQQEYLSKDGTIEAVLGRDFIKEYNQVFSFLRESAEPYEVENAKLRGYVRQINNEFISHKLNKSKVNNVMRVVKYASKYYRTGCKFGLFNFENKILTSLISQFSEGQELQLQYSAEVWHKCIY